MNFLLYFLVLFSFTSISLSDKFENFDHNSQLSPEVEVFWTIDETRKDILIGLKYYNAKGWVGFGLSETGGMKGADIVVLRKDKITQELILEDRFAREFALPSLDEEQNVYLFWAYQDETMKYTEFIFSRPLVSCDSQDRPINLESGSIVIFAYGDDHTFEYHGPNSRGISQVSWLKKNISSSIEGDEKTLTIRMPTYTIPAKKTTYLCTGYQVPLSGKHHVIKVNPLIDSKYVHHMILFRCDEPHPTEPQECNQMAPCVGFWSGWAVGGRPQETPIDVGNPIGNGTGCYEAGCAYNIVLQVHYDNPYFDSGVQDSSGFELVIANQLRKYDMGTITLGVLPNRIAIPPKTQDYLVSNICPGGCTSKYIPEEGLHLLGIGFHMHQVGSSIELRQIRNGVELPPLGNLSYWDFNYQAFVPVNGTILSGDTLETRCTYNTMTRSKVTKGGEGSSDEMCFVFLMYYPKIPLGYCFDLNGYTKQYALCIQDLGSTNDLSSEEAFLENTALMGNVTYQPYSQPHYCACDETCWTPPTPPTWLVGEPSDSSNTLTSFFSLFFSFFMYMLF